MDLPSSELRGAPHFRSCRIRSTRLGEHPQTGLSLGRARILPELNQKRAFESSKQKGRERRSCRSSGGLLMMKIILQRPRTDLSKPLVIRERVEFLPSQLIRRASRMKLSLKNLHFAILVVGSSFQQLSLRLKTEDGIIARFRQALSNSPRFPQEREPWQASLSRH